MNLFVKSLLDVVVARGLFMLAWNIIEWSIIWVKSYVPRVISHRCWYTCSHFYWAVWAFKGQELKYVLRVFSMALLDRKDIHTLLSCHSAAHKECYSLHKRQLEIITTSVTSLATKTLSTLHFVFTTWRLGAQSSFQWQCYKEGDTALKPDVMYPHRCDVKQERKSDPLLICWLRHCKSLSFASYFWEYSNQW